MRITEFKTNDVVTRNEPAKSKTNEDYSYTGSRLVFRSFDENSKIISFVDERGIARKLSCAYFEWQEGWALFPEEMWQKDVKFAAALRDLWGK